MRLVISTPVEVYEWDSEELEEEEEYEEGEDIEGFDDDDDDGDETEDELEEEVEEAEDDVEVEFVDDINDEDEEFVDPIRDEAILSQLSNVEYEGELFSSAFAYEEDAEKIKGWGISKGVIGLEFDEETKRLLTYTEYDITRELSDEELDFLIDFTIDQWLDGIGQEFIGEVAEDSGYLVHVTLPEDNEEVLCSYEEDEEVT